MRKFIIVLSYMLIAISCDDRCGDAIDIGYVSNKTDNEVNFMEFFSSGKIDTVVIRQGLLNEVLITQNYEYLNERLDSVIFEKNGKSVTYRNRKYGDNSNIANHYFNIDSWSKEEVCREIAFNFDYTLQNRDFD